MVLVNGVDTRLIDIGDRGFHYGDGVFTTLRILRGVPLFLEAHLSRLRRDAEQISLEIPEASLLRNEANSLAAHSYEGVLKMMVTRGLGGRGYRYPTPSEATRVLSTHSSPKMPFDVAVAGARVGVCRMRLGHNERLAGAKHLNRLEQVLARGEWHGDDQHEGLMLDQEGFVVEGTMSNVFFFNNNQLLTPLIDRCGVRGVMRDMVMELAKRIGINVIEGRVSLMNLMDVDEMFMTNSVIGIWPVGHLADRDLPPPRFTHQLIKELSLLVDSAVKGR